MKSLVMGIVLLYSCQYASADITFVLKNQQSKMNQQTITYAIKGHQLKFTESNSDRVNLFDQKTQQFLTFDPKSAKRDMINDDVLQKRVNQLNQQRLQKLAQVEQNLNAKLKTMTAQEQEVGESLINLLKYPEYYGEHTQLLVKPTDQQKQISAINCQVFQLFKNKQRLKEFCLADPGAMKMSPQEYQTLRSFYAFDYKVLTQLMLAMGKSDFTVIDYEEQKIPGVVIETISYDNATITQHLQLTDLKRETLEASEFTFTKAQTAN